MDGKKIKKLRDERKWSQRELGEYLGVEQATVSRLENDEWSASGPLLKLLETLSATPASKVA